MMNSLWDEVIVIGLLSIAAFLNMAVLNDDAISESRLMSSGRRLVIAAQILFVIRFGLLVGTRGVSPLTVTAFFAFTAWSLGSIMCSVDHMARRWGHSYKKADGTSQLPTTKGKP